MNPWQPSVGCGDCERGPLAVRSLASDRPPTPAGSLSQQKDASNDKNRLPLCCLNRFQ